MIVVRDVFQIAPEQMKRAKELAKQEQQFSKRHGYELVRILTDLSGDFYTLVFVSEFKSLADYEAGLTKVLADPEWQKFYGEFRTLIRGGRREMYSVVE
jgi:hypothetical protein